MGPLSLPLRPPLVALPSGVAAAGFSLDDHEAVLEAAQGLKLSGVPEAAVLKRRAEFVAGRLAAMSALQALGVAEQPGRSADGSPSWPAAAVGSISHGAKRALCIAGRRSEFRSLGIDAERVLDEDAKLELRQRICSEREREVLGVVLGLPDHARVSIAFSAKESLYKCLHPLVGRYLDFHAAEVVAASAEATGSALSGELTLRLGVDWSEALRAGRTFTASFVLAAEHVETAVALPA